jgi:hypothetical protein
MKLTPTERVLIEVLRENTGVHCLDSGGDHGRHWQRNQRRNFGREVPSALRIGTEIQVQHRVFHWLNDWLEYNAEGDSLFHETFRSEVDPAGDKCWGELRERFPDWFAQRQSLAKFGTEDGVLATGVYGEGDPVTVNTYNEPSLLDQVLLFTYFELRTNGSPSSDAFVSLQVHNGADVRGGYTMPRVFRVRDPESLSMFDAMRGEIACKNDHRWITDDAYHWYRDGASGLGAGKQLQQYEILPVERRTRWRENTLPGVCRGPGSFILGQGWVRGSIASS